MDSRRISWRVSSPAGPAPPETRRRREILRAADHVVLAFDREHVVGFVMAVSDGTFSAVLNLLEVLPGYRGQGIGSGVRRVLGEIGDLYMVDVSCDEEVSPFYQRLGFIPGRGMMIRKPAVIGGDGIEPSDPGGEGLAAELMAAANELRGIGAEGLRWSVNEYDRRRYERIMRLAAELTAVRDTRPADELERMFLADLSHLCPFVGANAAVFQNGRILLIQRRDDQLWAMPGGLVEIGESPSAAAVRETTEETGVQVTATGLLGLYDWGLAGGKGQPGHLHGYVFQCEPVEQDAMPVVTSETLDAQWVDPDSLPPLSGGHRTAVPDAIAVWRGQRPPVFH